MNFKRGKDPKYSIGIGKKTLIDKWFKEWAPNVNYKVDKNLHIEIIGYLDLGNTQITFLPDNLSVGGSLDLRNTQITFLPDNLSVIENIYKDF